MDNFENQIIDAMKKIRDFRQRPDAERIFRTITKDAATNVSLTDVQEKIDKVISVLSYKINDFKVWTPITFYQTVTKRIIVYVTKF